MLNKNFMYILIIIVLLSSFVYSSNLEVILSTNSSEYQVGETISLNVSFNSSGIAVGDFSLMLSTNDTSTISFNDGFVNDGELVSGITITPGINSISLDLASGILTALNPGQIYTIANLELVAGSSGQAMVSFDSGSSLVTESVPGPPPVPQYYMLSDTNLILVVSVGEMEVLGCIDNSACNYNEDATDNDGSCVYATGCDYCSGEMNGSGAVIDGDVDNDGTCTVDDCDDTNATLTSNSTQYLDSDIDTYGDLSSLISACGLQAGYVLDNTDCDDTNASINPGAEDIPDDGIDQDCDGSDEETLVEDCAGVPGGDSWESDCGCVAVDNSGDDCDGCDGTPNSGLEDDECGMCDGGGPSIDCEDGSFECYEADCPVELTGDLDNSGSVDSADAIAFTTAFKIGTPHGDADLDDNGSVNWDDIKEFLEAYLG